MVSHSAESWTCPKSSYKSCNEAVPAGVRFRRKDKLTRLFWRMSFTKICGSEAMTKIFGYTSYIGWLLIHVVSQNLVSIPFPSRKWAPKKKIYLHLWMLFQNWEPLTAEEKKSSFGSILPLRIGTKGILGDFLDPFGEESQANFFDLVMQRPPQDLGLHMFSQRTMLCLRFTTSPSQNNKI